MEELGKVAYEAYKKRSQGVSLIDGATLPAWEDLDGRIRQAWDAAADAVLAHDAEQRKSENKPS